ncbi:hypothetical protein [Deinococcus daejeonensis]|uniref:DUF2975 domain-containing protein n=1 Tax=Deinococcus daejeonensis TaxID=1007098 RepID=A0ABQ2IZH6_9DEIO|nr:hypothetical protein [Deinococcus daejeonensis]GGN32827.1 hypothetical protein GCM10010842_09940 [Deinococcus daejeonensis]
MLTPARAQTILSFMLSVMLVLTALALLLLLLGSLLQTTFSLTLPLNATLDLAGGQYGLSSVNLPLADLPVGVKAAWMVSMALLLTGLIALLWGARRFTRRLLSDPFHPANARDLTLAARLGLIGQVVAALQPLLNGWMFARIQPLETLRRQLPEDAIVRGMNTDSSLPFSLFGVDLTPLLIAAVCVLFATALTQAAHIREQERQLRAEQELTV